MGRRGRAPHIPSRPAPSGALPVVFGFPSSVKVDAALQARAALSAIIDGSGTTHDVYVLSRVGMYCVAMCEQMIKNGAVEGDGLADAAEAVTAGVESLAALIQRFESSGSASVQGNEGDSLTGLVEAYEAIFTTATRRESAQAMARMPGLA